MSDLQRDAYEDSTEINSDPFGILNRDNRNHQKKLDIILEHTNATPGDAVLEVGCGHGLHASRYADRFDYLGIDLSDSLVEATRSRIERGEARQMDAIDIDLEDAAVDAVVGTAILHHLPEPEEALREWIRVTESGGSITLMEPNYLFPKDLITAHCVPEERNKTNMAPWRLRRMLAALDVASWKVEPRIYTPPWPEGASDVLDRVDDTCRHVPGLRSMSQMLLIHVEC